jgi:hypothetical protein
MIVDITDGAAVLAEPDDCGRFEVRVADGLPTGTLDTVLSTTGAGRRSGSDQVAVNVAWLRTVARDVQADWPDRFDKMLTFAGTKGWLTDDGTAVLGHIVRN